MAKPLTWESLDTKPKFTVKLDNKTHKDLIRYLLLTKNPTGRNKLINKLIEKELGDKLLTNTFISLYQNPYYFNKNELLENKKVIATKKPILHNQKEIFVVRQVPNNLDDFNEDLGTYCEGNNKHIHVGYYILPKYKEYDEKHFTFRYDSKKEEIEINIVSPNDINTLFNPLDDKKQKIKNKLLAKNLSMTYELKNNEFDENDILRNLNVMYNYEVNLELEKLRKEGVKPKDHKPEHKKLYFDAVFF